MQQTKKIISLPHRFDLRPYQQKIFEAYFVKKMRRFISIWHRRAGKDRTFFNLMIAASQERIGNYAYFLPELVQAREVLWIARDKDGLSFLDHIPIDIIDHVNNSEMIVYFKNGSTLQLGGSDHYNRHRGTSYAGVVFSEYSFGHPLAWEYIRPILTQNKGWAAFAYTPNGNNHGRKLYDTNKNNPAWYTSLLTIKDTKTKNGKPIITKEDIEEEIRSGMSEEDAEQEFMCSFTAAVKGAYFGKLMNEAEKEGRILDFAIDKRYPVMTAWDLGFNDTMSIWFFQLKPEWFIDMIYYYENQFEDMNHYVQKINDVRKTLGIVYSNHYLPHDGAHRTHLTGDSTVSIARKLGLQTLVIPRTQNKKNLIQTTKTMIPIFRFHKTNCKIGISALENYKSRYNKTTAHFGEPLHDWASHGADSFMGVVQSRRMIEKNTLCAGRIRNEAPNDSL